MVNEGVAEASVRSIELANQYLGVILVDMMGHSWIEELSRGAFTSGFLGVDIKSAQKTGAGIVSSHLGEIVFAAAGREWCSEAILSSWNRGKIAAEKCPVYRKIVDGFSGLAQQGT